MFLIVSILTIAVFLLDLKVSLGIAAGVTYVLPVAIAGWFPQRRHTVICATVCTLFTIAGFLSSPAGMVGVAVINRTLTVLCIWTVAILSISLLDYRKKAQQAAGTESSPRLMLTEADCGFNGSAKVLGAIISTFVLAGLSLQAVDWQGSRELHTLMESCAVLLAMMGGLLCLIRYYSRYSITHLYIGVGLIGTGILDGLHAVVTSSFFAPLARSAPESLIPWSWNASRLFLAFVLLVTFSLKRKAIVPEQRQAHEQAVYFGVMAITVAWVAFFGFVPLPSGYSNGFLGRPLELLPAALFLVATCFVVKRNVWRTDSFEFWVLASLLVNLVCQTIVMTRSFGLFDTMFDLAHLMKIVSYCLILVGVMQNIQILYRVADSTSRELEVANTRFDLAVKGASDGLWDWQVQSESVWYSPRFRELLGFETDDSANFPDTYSSFHSRLHPDDADATNASIASHLELNDLFDCEFRLKRSDGEYRWFRARASSTRDDSGHAIRMSGSIQDVHARKEAESALRTAELRLEQALDGAEVAIWDWNVLTGELYVSPQLTLQLGETGTWTTVDDWLAHIHPDDRESAWLAADGSLSGETGNYEDTFRLRHADGTYRWVLARGQVFRDESGTPNRMMGVHLDLTERKEAERLLSKQARDLLSSNAELERFAYVASHDLQEPLRAVAGYIQLLEMDYAEKFDDVAKTYMQHTVEGVVRMQTLIRDLLEYSRVMRKAEPFVEINPAKCIDDACKLLELSISDSEAVIEVDVPQTVFADSAQMTRLFQNLIGNSLKYRSGSPPRITITHKEITGAGCWEIRVQDNGIGIEPRFAERIFVIFQRLHTREEYPGTGLGLAVCRRIMERHGGSIHVDTNHDSAGTAFVLKLPFEPEVDASNSGYSADGNLP